MTNDDIDRSKLSFEQAEGFEPLPSQMALHQISREARAILWKHVYESLWQDRKYEQGVGYVVEGRWKEILRDYFVYRMEEPLNQFNEEFDHHVQFLEKLFFNGKFQAVFTFIQDVLRHKYSPRGLETKIKQTLEEVRAAYTLVLDGATIVPVVSEEEGKAIEAAFATTAAANLMGARAHLVNACEELNEGNYADSIRESVHAVESTARKIDPKASKKLGPALKTLERGGALNPVLKIAIEKLYGYSNAKEGIRHPLLDDPDKVGSHEAVFMLGACASFISYLVNKGRDAGLLEQ